VPAQAADFTTGLLVPRCTRSPHHVLIVSGLYGLLTPEEPIQCYSCHVTDHPRIVRHWTDSDRLTQIVVSYIAQYGITTVFDLMADGAYRLLLNWEAIQRAVSGNVRHCFSEEFAGAELLPSLGLVARRFLGLPEEALLRIQPGHVEPVSLFDAGVVFEPSPVPVAASVITDGRQDRGASQEELVAWMETLPFPLASILWLADATVNPETQVEHLFHFFEAFAQFTATLLLSAYAGDKAFYTRESAAWIDHDPRFHNSFATPSFGTWNTLAERLAKHTRRLLGDMSQRERCLELFGFPAPEFIDILTDKDLYAALKQVATLRNDWKGHGGIVGTSEARTRAARLVDQLTLVRKMIGEGYAAVTLLVPGTSQYKAGTFHYQARALRGTRLEFRTVAVETDTPMEAGRLHLVHQGRRRPVALLPFVRLIESPKAGQEACYFYNRLQGDSVRWVSYHFTAEAELRRQDDEVRAALDLLRP
ncbi:MAG TPA: hypothetical protein VLA19_30210, partial [Herpetosiphonaceae bacterium]|nr:hypothetical protein [Herpetosiphonaceae bacterium]